MINKLFIDNVNFIQQTLEEYKHCKKVVITHHTPLMDGTSHPRFNGSSASHAFSTDLRNIVENVDYWICGHTHHCATLNYKNAQILLNCKGYNNEQENYNPSAFIDISFEK